MGGPCLSDVRSSEQAGFRQALLNVYVPRYGPEWETFLDSGPVYARIEADRMFTFYNGHETLGEWLGAIARALPSGVD
jgi:hypothetical protein